jgi:hypothetical protein
MKKPSYLLLFAFALFFANAVFGQMLDKTKQYTPVAIGFWNVENFYDTLNDPLKEDEEFLPEGTYRWDGNRYKKKLEHISDVVSQLGIDASPDGVAIMGFCEIENRSVLEDIAKTPKLAARNYKIAHVEGPDKRGVDVALLYNPKYFKVTSMHAYKVTLVTDSTYPTRDELLVSGDLLGERFHRKPLALAPWRVCKRT